MEGIHLLDLFQGIATLVAADPKIFWGRIGLILLGFLLIYLGKKGVLEALLMITTVDGVHPAELDYLAKVSALMGFGEREWLYRYRD